MPTSANEFEQFRSGEPPAALWGEADSGGVVTPPAAPTLSVSGTTATIAGSTAGSTNVLTVSLAVAGTGFTWATEGSRTGDGDIALTLDAGYYWGIVTSTTADGSAVSNLVYFRIGDFSGDLDHSTADIVRYLLIALGHGTLPPATDWPIYEGAEPTAPDALVTTYNVTGVDGGDPIDTTTQHNTEWRTMAARTLKTLTQSQVSAAYDPNVYNNILSLINVETSVTVRFPDGSTLDFWGYLKSFEPQSANEGNMPMANVQIVPTNTDPSDGSEADPVLTSVAGT